MTALETAVTRVRARANYCHKSLPWPRERVLAYAALEYTVGHVSAPQYGVNHPLDTDPSDDADPDEILAEEAGICGHAGIVMQAILGKISVQTRHVEIYYGTNGGHVAVEVAWLGMWHYFDPTWGTLYVTAGDSVLGLRRVLELGAKRNIHEVSYRSHLWRNLVERVPGGPQATGLAALDNPTHVTSGGVVYLDVEPKPADAAARIRATHPAGVIA